MEKINKKTMLYKTGVEYGDYTVNHVLGCSHGCAYPCYAYLMAHRFGKAKTIEEWMDVKIYDNTLDILEKELIKMHSKIKSVQLCFSTDPFMYNHPDVVQLSIDIIKMINSYGIPCYILTKGILPKELANLDKINFYGITYVSNDENFKNHYESNAAPLADRLNALRYLSENGCKTWVSMEPYPTPNIVEQNIEDVLDKVHFVNRIVFGRLNYNKIVSKYLKKQEFYNYCTEKVVAFCKNNSIDFHIKKGTYKDDTYSG